MRFQNQTAVAQQICWTDCINRKTQVIPAGAIVIGEIFLPWARPVGPLVRLSDHDEPQRTLKQRTEDRSVRPDLLPRVSFGLRQATKTSQAGGVRWAPQFSRSWDNPLLFDQFYDKRALAYIVNTTSLPEDSVSVIVGRIVEARVLRPSPTRPAETKRIAGMMGTVISSLQWRHWAKSTPDGMTEGYVRESAQTSQPETANDAEMLAEWSEFFAHRSDVENTIALAIHAFIEGK